MERGDAQRPGHLQRLGRERRRAHERRSRAGRCERGGGPGRRRVAPARGERGVEPEEAGALLVAGVGGGRGVAVEVPAGVGHGERAPERVPAAEHLPAPHRPARDPVGDHGVPVAHRLLHAHVAQPVRVHGRLPAAEGHAVDGPAAPVVVEGDRRVAGLGRGLKPAVVLEAVRAAVERPELHVLPARVHRAHEVAGQLVERPRAAQEAGHGGEHGVGVGGVARPAGVAEAQVAHPVARLGVGARGRGQRRLHAHVGLGHLLGVGRGGGHALLGAVGAQACGRDRERDRDHHCCAPSCPGPHGAGC